MKTFRSLFITGIAILTGLFTFTSCSDDDKNDDKDYSIVGTWQVKNADVDVTPKADAAMTEAQLEAFLTDYTFFAKNSDIIFTTDSVTLTAELAGTALPPFKLAYTLQNDILTIASPIPSITIQGTVDIKARTMDFDLTPASYMSILQFIGYSFPDLQPTLNQVATAQVDYSLTR